MNAEELAAVVAALNAYTRTQNDETGRMSESAWKAAARREAVSNDVR